MTDAVIVSTARQFSLQTSAPATGDPSAKTHLPTSVARGRTTRSAVPQAGNRTGSPAWTQRRELTRNAPRHPKT